MRKIFALTLLATLLLGGCGSPPKSLAGQWATAKGTKDSLYLDLARDNTFVMLAGNEFAAGMVSGKYTFTADTLTLSATGADAPPGILITFHYQWRSPSSLSLTSAQDTKLDAELTLMGPGLRTASLDAIGAGTSHDSADPKTQNITCLSNLRQLDMAMQMYVQDYDEVLPAASTWSNSLVPYIKQITLLTCPALKKAGKEGGYAMNSELGGIGFKSIAAPPTTVLLFESSNEQVGTSDPLTSLLKIPRHDGKINFAYADGHVKPGP